MTEIVFLIIILALIGLYAFQSHLWNKERAKLTNALIAKTPEQYRDLEMTDRIKLKVESPKNTEFIPSEELTDDEFTKAIQKEING